VNQAAFLAEVTRVCDRLGPDVVEVITDLGHDWTGEPAVFFMVILADSATSKDRLFTTAKKVTEAIERELEPMERWDVFAYFNFRSKSEQDKLNNLTAA
jgi:hypothetical protein